jgi:hypothetical protein
MLNLKETLARAGISKPVFDARRRRDLHGFLHEHPSWDNAAVAEHENKQRKWTNAHVTALACVEHANKAQGISVEMADSIVSNNFGLLVEAFTSGAISQRDFLVGAIFFGEGREHFAGTVRELGARLMILQDRASEEAHPLWAVTGMQMINASAIYAERICEA